MKMAQGIFKNQFLPYFVPESIVGPIRGGDVDGAHRMNIAAVSIIRMTVAYGMFKVIQKYKADSYQVTKAVAGVVSAPAAGVYWSARALQRGLEEMKKAFTKRDFTAALKGTGFWTLGCLTNIVSQNVEGSIISEKFRGMRWGVLEILNYRITKNVQYRQDKVHLKTAKSGF